jgi:hypothetical protein
MQNGKSLEGITSSCPLRDEEGRGGGSGKCDDVKKVASTFSI